MNIHFVEVGRPIDAPYQKLKWPTGWPVPLIGDEVDPGDGRTVTVRTVVWYPYGDPDNDDLDPFIYVVLGPTRR